MDTNKLFQRAKALIDTPKTKLVFTPELIEYIGADIVTPMGRGRISSIAYSHTRRVQGKAYSLYTLTIDIADQQYRITTYEHTQWSMTCQ
jgi:hypothetical protein